MDPRKISGNNKIHSVFLSTIIIRVIKSRILRWAGHVGRMEDSSAFKMLMDKPTGRICIFLGTYIF